MLRLHCYVFFFFSSRRRHTRFDCDWSSDVCSSDLGTGGGARGDRAGRPRDRAAGAPRVRAGVGGHAQGRGGAGRARGRGRSDQRRVGPGLRSRARARGGGRRGRGDRHAHARHAGHDGWAGGVPARGGRGRRRAGCRRGGGRGRGRAARAYRGGPGVRVREGAGAELPPARRAGHRGRLGVSCSGRAVAQALPRGRHGAAGRGSRPRHGRGVRARVGAWSTPVPGARRRARVRGAAGGRRDDERDERTVSVEAYRFLIPRFWPDVVEILLVAFVIYRFLLFLVGTRAMQIVVGVMILSIAYFASLLAKFTMISALLSYVFTFGAFAAVV